MTIMLSGGGTGGHITPIITVASKLKQKKPDIKTVYVGERRSKFKHMTENNESLDTAYQVFSGKYRRYHNESFANRVKDARTLGLNIRDIFYVLVGFLQALYIVRKERPGVIFLKGGYVGVPVGLAAAFWRVPIVTHDSDAVAGLANRVVSRWARVHATALGADSYPYDASKMREVGVVINDDFVQVDANRKQEYRKRVGLPASGTVLLVTGGSSGAEFINTIVRKAAPELLESHKALHIVHQVGASKKSLYDNYAHPRLHVVEFLDDLHVWSGAADVIVMRAGANTLAEFGAQGKACIVIPGPHLAGGHQVQNAAYLGEKSAIIVLHQETLTEKMFYDRVETVIKSTKLQHSLARSLHLCTRLDAGDKLADILLAETRA